MARSITTRSTNPKIMDDNIKILDDALGGLPAPDASDVSYDNTDSGLTATDAQAAIDEVNSKFNWTLIDTGITSESDPVDVMGYTEFYIVPKIAGFSRSAPLYFIKFSNNFNIGDSYVESGNYKFYYRVTVNDNALTLTYSLETWTSVTFDIYGK